MPFHRWLPLLALLLCLATPAWLQGDAHAAASKKRTSAEQAPKKESSSHTGYLLVDLDSGQVLDSSREEELFIPASVSKVPSTLAALHILGADHRFVTRVESNGSVINGVLKGDLVLVGGGDPSFAMAGLMDLVQQLRHQGIERVQGRFLYDESALVPEENISDEQNEDETYNQGVSALTLDFNRVRLNWSLSKKSGRLLANIVPDLGYVELMLGESSRSGPSLVYLGGDAAEQWRLNPRWNRSGWEWVPIKRPAHYAALLFREFCHRVGLELTMPEAGRILPRATTLASHASAPLADLVDVTLEHSNNLWTELIGMGAASHLAGKPQSVAEAAGLLAEWLTRQMPEVDWKGFHLANSCGLSAASRISPRQMVAILQWADREPPDARAIASLMPISGWKGTLAGRFSGPESSLRVWAKTGTINYGKALAGYLFTPKNKRLAFAVFASDIERRRAFDEKMGQHVSEDLARGRDWNGQASGRITALVEGWLRNH